MKNHNPIIATSVPTPQSNNLSKVLSECFESVEAADIATGEVVGGQIYKGDSSMGQDVSVLALVKGEERYVFLYNDTSRSEALRTLGRYASNPELSFTWYDAAVLSQKIRQESQHLTREQQQSEFYNQSRYDNIYSKAAEEID
ncbi:MAG: hypothetical protein LBK06_05915 [Planctomycetaceae bacterium]|jgi:hypothetical protein|nr:hypothetical protein [Planctomycetaceae bacterium]